MSFGVHVSICVCVVCICLHPSIYVCMGYTSVSVFMVSGCFLYHFPFSLLRLGVFTKLRVWLFCLLYLACWLGSYLLSLSTKGWRYWGATQPPWFLCGSWGTKFLEIRKCFVQWAIYSIWIMQFLLLLLEEICHDVWELVEKYLRNMGMERVVCGGYWVNKNSLLYNKIIERVEKYV